MRGLDEAALPGEAGPNDLDVAGEAALDQALAIQKDLVADNEWSPYKSFF